MMMMKMIMMMLKEKKKEKSDAETMSTCPSVTYYHRRNRLWDFHEMPDESSLQKVVEEA